MKKNKLKMSNLVYRLIVIPLVVLALILAVALQTVAGQMPDLLDDYLGRGALKTQQDAETASLDSNYYDAYENNEVSKAASYELAAQVQEEGTVLLKNNGLLPMEKGSQIVPFGYRYLKPVYGQLTASGSAKWVMDPVTPEKGISEQFTVIRDAAERMEKAGDPKGLLEAEGTLSAGTVNDLLGGDSKIYEYDPSIYDGIDQYPDAAALVVISRAGQEGSDKKHDGYEDGTPHYLAFSQNELETIRKAKETCGHLIVVLATSAPMELMPIAQGELEADAIIQVGHTGERGFAALGKILCGDVNPSGRTVDIWPADFTKDPTYQNFGEFTYTNAAFSSHSFGSPSSANEDGTFDRYFVEYEEGVYMGYRFYETAAVMDPSYVYGSIDKGGAVTEPGSVIYPFGYGLSFTDFQQTIRSYSDEGDAIEVEVEVKNTGDIAGKDVVELYYSAPYTDLDVELKVEKPVTVLGAFDKTQMLEPGASETIKITLPKEEMASYCYTRDNGDGTAGAYFLEEGEYTISLNRDSHSVIDSRTFVNGETIWYDNSNPRKSEIEAQSERAADGSSTGEPMEETGIAAAVNLFQESNDYMNSQTTMLTRADWVSTFPTRPENGVKEVGEEFLSSFGLEETFDPKTDPLLGNTETSVYAGSSDREVKKQGLMVSDMRGLSYNDPKWDEFLNQVDFSNAGERAEVVRMMTVSNYATYGVKTVGLPPTREADGANGIKSIKTDAGMELTATYGYAPLMASTWNTDLLYEVGRIFGQEALATGIAGWYSPAINMHRSQFAGRIYEYYSEDPLLTGKMAAAVVSGAGDSGMFCYIKHFAVNEQERNREFFLHTWATEQAMRELYLKAFEIPFKEAMMTIRYLNEEGQMTERTMRAATAVMTAQNNIGSTISHGNYALITSLLRGEWGFRGIVHSDMFIWGGAKNMFDLSFRAGLDTFLTMGMFSGMTEQDSPESHAVMRRALHDVSYTMANSLEMQGLTPGSYRYYATSPWRYLVTAATILFAGLAVLGIVSMVRRTKDARLHPELYKSRKNRQKK